MLLQFTVKNYRSFRDATTFSMLADISSKEDVAGDPLLENPASKDSSLLKSALIYGPNASGKSNLLSAMLCLREVLEAERKPDAFIRECKPFYFDKRTALQPVHFEVEVLIEGIRHRYSLVFNAKTIVEEELVFYPKLQPALLFRRDKKSFKLGESLEQKKIVDFASERTRPNQCFLTKAAEENHAQLGAVYRYFTHSWMQLTADYEICKKRAKDPVFREKAVVLLRGADTGIVGLDVMDLWDEELIEESIGSDHLKRMSPERKEVFLSAMKERMSSIPGTLHDLYDGDKVVGQARHGFGSESKGTNRLFELSPLLIDVLEKGGVLFMDELEDSLHPDLAAALVTLFNSPANRYGAQLIATTHMTSLLGRKGLMRRDQIWFTEKDQKGASCLFSLNDFPKTEVRSTSPWEDWYLANRFGALPRVDFTEFATLLGKESFEETSDKKPAAKARKAGGKTGVGESKARKAKLKPQGEAKAKIVSKRGSKGND